jgi:hypothetical protein
LITILSLLESKEKTSASKELSTDDIISLSSYVNDEEHVEG